MDWSTKNPYSIARDWNKLQGYTHPSDEHIHIRRDVDTRRVSVENSSRRPISIAVVPYPGGPIPPPLHTLQGGEIINVGVNPVDGPMQYLHILDPISHRPVGVATPFRTDSNSFVLRDGLQKWFVQAFQSTGYRG
jgi:hypothetical protein